MDNNNRRLLEFILIGDDLNYFWIQKAKKEILKLIPEFRPCVDCKQSVYSHSYDVYDHILYTVMYTENDLILRLRALFHDVGKPYVKGYNPITERITFRGHEGKSAIIAKDVMTRFGYNEDDIKKVEFLVRYHDTFPKNIFDTRVKEILNDSSCDIDRLVSLKYADAKAHAESYVPIKEKNVDMFKQIMKKSYKRAICQS